MKPVAPSKIKSRRPHASLRNVHFEFVSPDAENVQLVGTFNGWKAETGEMTRMANGRWVKDLLLEPGVYEYRFVVDGDWVPDPQADHSVTNPGGGKSSLLSVRAGNGS